MMEIQSDRRYEIKMTAENEERYVVERWVRLNRFAFKTAFPKRVVNNIYFDTEGMDTYFDHVNGVEQRKKLRFRWYGKTYLIKNGQLEVKHKENNLGWKWIEPVNYALDLNTTTWDEMLSALRKDKDPRMGTLLSAARPVLVNRYSRDYYVSADGQIRITLDYDLENYTQSFGAKPNLIFKDPGINTLVIEFKSDIHQAKSLADVLAQFPLRVNAYSKYINGIENGCV